MTWADWVLAGLTAVSIVVAILALGHSRRAVEAAAGAVLEAKDANRIAKDANQIATASNTIASDAAQDARDAPTAMAWDAYIVSLAAMQSADPTDSTTGVGPLLTEARTRATLLVDRLAWEGFDDWVAAEHVSGVLLMREAMERGEAERRRLRRGLTPDEVLKIDENFHLWVAALTSNVRLCRNKGPGGLSLDPVRERAWAQIRAVSARNNWPVPSGKVEGLPRLTRSNPPSDISSDPEARPSGRD